MTRSVGACFAACAIALLSAWPGAGLAAAAAAAASEECGCLAHRLEAAAEAARFAAAPAPGRGGAFDPAVGADHRNYPRDPLVEYRGMVLDMNVPDLAKPHFTAVQRLTVRPIGVPVRALTLDAEGLSIQGVTVNGAKAEWSHDGHSLAIRFAEPLAAGDTVIETTYACNDPLRGMTFSPAAPEIEGVSVARAPELHTQGQTETNHYWFPMHDSPNVRLPTELIVNVPKDVVVSGNGALVKHETKDDREVWQWKQDKPHVPYLVSLVAGGFERVELPNSRSGVPMTVWLAPGRADDARATYANTDAMMALFERRFGVKYPWARYDQLVVRNFGSGGMENTSATTMHPSAVFDATARAEGDMDGLIAHELCHQWTGDLITCKSWAHIWLNEGWATYGSTLWNEERFGQDGYYDSVLSNANVARRDTPEAGEAMCSPVWTNAGETFGRAANPYPKGASILHMLRRMLGDEIFFKGVQQYMKDHAGGLVETSDFRYAMEAASGLGLEWFFEQWCDRPGSPNVKASARYDAATRTLTVKAEQTQTIDARTPALRISIPVWVRTAKGEQVVPFEMRGQTAEVQAVLDGPPQAVWVDPWLEALKVLEVDQPAEWTLATMRAAPTIAARRQALATLAKTDTPEARAALVEIASNAGASGGASGSGGAGGAGGSGERYTIRVAAIEALAGYGSPEAKAAVIALFDAGAAEPRVRAAQVEALRKCDKADAVGRLTAVLAPVANGGTASYAARVAAIDGLVALDAASAASAPDVLQLIRAQVAMPSQGEAVSQAALRALARWGTAEDITAVKDRARLGIMDRARPEALETLAAMAPRLDDSSRADIEVFALAMLDDRESRTATAAGNALAKMKSKAALPRLQSMAEHDRDPSKRARAEKWVKTIQG